MGIIKNTQDMLLIKGISIALTNHAFRHQNEHVSKSSFQRLHKLQQKIWTNVFNEDDKGWRLPSKKDMDKGFKRGCNYPVTH